MSESLLKELPNINHFTSTSIISKSILIKSIISRIDSTKEEPNTDYFYHRGKHGIIIIIIIIIIMKFFI